MRKATRFPVRALIAIITAPMAAYAIYQSEVILWKENDPTGRYTAICTSRWWWGWIPSMPGQGSDRPCFIEIVDQEGKNRGKIPVPMIQMAEELEWSSTSAEIKLVGRWDFEKKTCRYWSKNQDREIFVRQ